MFVSLVELSVVGRFFFIFYFFKILFIHERYTERGRDTGRGRSRLHADLGSPGSGPGLQAALNH